MMEHFGGTRLAPGIGKSSVRMSIGSIRPAKAKRASYGTYRGGLPVSGSRLFRYG
jgi:hypothetical protein